MSQINVNLSKSLNVSEDVIAGVITNAVKEIKGVYGISPSVKTLRQFILKEKSCGDINIEMVDGVLSVSVGVELENGAKQLPYRKKCRKNKKLSPEYAWAYCCKSKCNRAFS